MPEQKYSLDEIMTAYEQACNALEREVASQQLKGNAINPHFSAGLGGAYLTVLTGICEGEILSRAEYIRNYFPRNHKIDSQLFARIFGAGLDAGFNHLNLRMPEAKPATPSALTPT